MRSSSFKSLATSLAAMSYVLASSSAVMADDTEIFFNAAYSVETRPNILFVIDTSGSMGSTPSTGGSLSKLQIVKNAMNQLLTEVEDVNVGLARYTVPGGPIVQPVLNIDDPANPRLSIRVTSGSDDAEEASDGSVRIDSGDLDIVEESDHAKWVAVRFNRVDIPKGATIVGATVAFEAMEAGSGSLTTEIYGELSSNAAAFTATANDISARPRTGSMVTWTPGSWATVDSQYATVDISSIIQEIVGQSDWCGGNSLVLMIKRSGAGTNKRVAYSYEGDPNQTAQLRLQYAGDSGVGGCFTKTIVARVGEELDDIEQNWAGTISTGSGSLDLRTSNDRAIGLRFPNVLVPQGADILDARLEFTASRGDTGTTTVKVEAVAEDNFAAFSSTANTLTSTTIPPGLNKTSSVNITLGDFASGATTPVHAENLASVVKAVTNRTGWEEKNALALVLTYQSGSRKGIRAFNTGSGPRLNIRYKTTYEEGAYTVRQEMQRSVNELLANGYTPISDTLLEAGLYYRGGDVLYGKTRNSSARNLVSNPATYTGGTHVIPGGCDPVLDPFSSACAGERITGTPVYTSPITDSCQKNHIVFLTDGLPTWHAPQTSTTFAGWPGAGTCIAGTGVAGETATGVNGDDCTIKIAQYLHEKDQSGLPATQTVTSHFIGFDVDAPFLETAAASGGGSYYQANDAELLLESFRDIINNILQTNGSFVSAGVTTSQSNRLRHEDQLYFSIFGPTLKPRWPGNVKRYRLAGSELVDVNDQPAVNPSSDQFRDEAQSWWSPEVDGNNPSKGGTASQLTADRTIYSNLSGSSDIDLTSAGNVFETSNTAVLDSDLGVTAAERDALMAWANGRDVDDEDADGDVTEPHFQFTDPLHSRPTLLRYDDGGTEFTRVYVGTNSGFLSSINTETGAEEWAFLPKELVGNLKTLRANVEGTLKPYGMDGTIVPYFNDANRDGKVNVGDEEAFIIVGMRRGGSNYYVIDISNPDVPRLKYVMGRDNPTIGSYPKLEQSWSAPSIARIKWGGDDKLVAIFGAGYDITQDTNGPHLADGNGNAVYIADLETGEQLWSSDSLAIATMTNSIPADPAVIDLNSDGFSDHIYVTDTAAQVFRFDLSLSGTITGGRLAHLQPGTDHANNRRFFARVDVAKVERSGGEDYLALTVGSGFREGPLDVTINDYFYMIRDFGVFNSSFPDDVTMDDLLDITDLVGDVDGDGDNLDALEKIEEEDKLGWYYDFSTSGEKVLAQASILNGVVYFSTYMPPDTSAGSVDCSGGTGSSRLYAVSLTDGNPIKDTDGDGLNDGDRFINIENCATCGFTPLQMLVGETSVTGILGTTVIDSDLLNYGLEKVKRVKWRTNDNN